MFYRVTVFPLGLCTLIQRNIFFIRDLKLHRFCLWVRIGAHVCLESDCWYQWMHSDKFKLNSDKTECLLIGTRQQLQKVSNISTLSFGDSQIAPSCEVRNLGTWFDSKMSMLSHINKTCSSAFYYLYNMRRIRKYLSRSVTESLVHAFITSRIDYCNSLLYGLPNSHIMKLQRIQNAAARLVTGTPRFCHVTPLLFHLHWLAISYRIKFKILLLTFKCLYGQAPNYLIDLITIKHSRYSLRSRVYIPRVTWH